MILAKRTAVEGDHGSLYIHLQVLLDEFRKCQKRPVLEEVKKEEFIEEAPPEVKEKTGQPENEIKETIKADEATPAGPSRLDEKKREQHIR